VRHDEFRKLSAFGKLTQYPSDEVCLLAKEGPWIEVVAQETSPFIAFRFVKRTAYPKCGNWQLSRALWLPSGSTDRGAFYRCPSWHK
jgi:hypothetical protein